MRAGSMNCLVELQHRIATPDETGDPIVTWEPYAQVFAHLRPITGGEDVAQQQIHARRTTRMAIRYREDVVPTDRVIFEGVPYNVETVLKKDFKRWELALILTDGVIEE